MIHADSSGPLPRGMNIMKYKFTFTDKFGRYIHVAGTTDTCDVDLAVKMFDKECQRFLQRVGLRDLRNLHT